MAAGFALTAEALQTARSDVERVHATLSAALGDVRAELTSLVGESWRGSAATAFRSGFDEWERGAVDVMEALRATGALLDRTQRDYVGSDTAATDRLAHRLGSSG